MKTCSPEQLPNFIRCIYIRVILCLADVLGGGGGGYGQLICVFCDFISSPVRFFLFHMKKKMEQRLERIRMSALKNKTQNFHMNKVDEQCIKNAPF